MVDVNIPNFLDTLTDISSHFLVNASRDNIKHCLSESGIVKAFVSTTRTEVIVHPFFALYEYASTGESGIYNVGIVDSLVLIPSTTTACVTFSRHLPSDLGENPDPSSCTESEYQPSKGINLAPLPSISINDISFQSVNLKNPVGELSTSLVAIYEPLCRGNASDNIVSSQITELIGAIRSNTSLMIDFKVTRYIHPDLLKLCNENPTFSPKELIAELGPKASDNSFLKELQLLAAKCVNIFNVDIFSHSVGTIREEAAYWQHMDTWMDDIRTQLQSREWQLVQRVLQKRADSTVEKTLADKKSLVNDFHRFLSSVPYRSIIDSARDNLTSVVRQVFEQLSRSQKFPPDRLMKVADAIVDEICGRVLGIAKATNILTVNPSEALEFLLSLRNILNEAQNGYTQIKDLRGGGGRRTDIQPAINRTMSRIQQLQDFINNHVSLLEALKNIFVTEHQELITTLEEEYENLQSKSSVLWELQGPGEQAFKAAMTHYNGTLDKLDDAIALLVRNKLDTAASGEEMFRVHETFQKIRREKVKVVISNKHEELILLIGQSIETIKERYFDPEAGKRAIHIYVANGYSPIVATIMYHKTVEHALNEQLKKRDAVSEFGWHQLLSFQTIDFQWMLNEQLASFLGVSLSELTKDPRIETASPEIYGTAFALAFLELLYVDEKSDWERSIQVVTARQTLEKKDTQALTIAMNFFRQNGVGSRQIANRDKARDLRLFKDKINQGIKENVQKWCQLVRGVMSQTEIDAHSRMLAGKVFIMRGNIIDVNFPVTMTSMMADLKMLMSLDLISTSSNTFDDVRMFLENNENRIAIAVGLQHLLDAFYQKQELDEDGHLSELLSKEYHALYQLLLGSAKYRWSTYAVVEAFTEKLATQMNDFCTLMDEVRAITSNIDDIIVIMEHDICDPVNISRHINEIKYHVNDLVIKTPNSKLYLARLQPRVDEILCSHLQNIIFTWLDEFESLGTDSTFIEKPVSATMRFKLTPLKITMRVMKDDVRLDSIPSAWRTYWYDKFNEAIDWINAIPHFDTRGGVGGGSYNVTKNYYNSYSRLIDKLPEGLLKCVYNSIENVIGNTINCEERWRSNQQFYSLDVAACSTYLGDDLQVWQDTISEIRRDASEQMDDTQPLLLIGGIVIDTREAQDRLASRFEQLHAALDKRFREVVASHFTESYNSMRISREAVENSNANGDLSEAIALLSIIQDLDIKVEGIKQKLPMYQMSEKILKSKGNVQFSSNWISVERVVGEFSTLVESIDRKKEIIANRRTDIEKYVQKEAAAIHAQITKLETNYRQANIADGNIPAAEALNQVSRLFDEAIRCEDKLREVQKSQNALGEEPIQSSKLESLLSDIKGQKQAYESVSELYAEINTLKTIKFTEVQPRSLQQAMYGIQERMINVNPAVRHFTVFTTLEIYLKELLACHRFIQDLRSEAIQDRHWVTLRNQLKQKHWVISELTVGNIWESKPVVNSKIYLSVIDSALGQHRLQMQIDQISEFWNNHPLETIFFQNKVTLVKGWDTLFEKLGEDLNSLTAMKLSPHYADNIAATTNDWDEKLNRAYQILEILVDVQRRWVYIDGIFSGSIEIRHQLPSVASQFDKTSREFVYIMPRLKGEAITVLRLISVEKIQQTLEKIARELNMIQKTLGEYLETQRAHFPRFYFVGDEDLLEVIGNGKDPLLVAKHLKKMFCGISALVVESNKEKSHLINSMVSAEVETVEFNKPFDTNGLAVYEWLTQLEHTMMSTLRHMVANCINNIPGHGQSWIEWIRSSPAQITALCVQIHWVRMVENELNGGKNTDVVEKAMSIMLAQLATDVLLPGIDSITRHKIEQAITVAVYQRDKARKLASKNVNDVKDFEWLCTMRPYFENEDVNCKMADASFEYSFEYFGLAERLVQTSLTDKCFLTLTQALHTRLGGSPSGPAGTGKTETVKALGMQLGRFVLVFNCDETFDYKSMGRIFVGLCQVGAWGCFDEFNRLEERILSAVSQQIQCIQEGLKSGADKVILAERNVSVHHNMGMFITMNPGYAGRSNLPDNLKQLFRGVAMTSPDRENIAEVMLFAQGFKTAETLSRKIVPLFRLCRDQLSQQSHYDFGLRALKSVLVSAGGLKRASARAGQMDLSETDEIRLMMQSLTETIVPKLVADDVDLLNSLLSDVFPGCRPKEVSLDDLHEAIKKEAMDHAYNPSELWVSKIIQLYKILNVNHGIMLVGGSGCGKTAAWMTLLRALARLEDVDGHAYVIDPKALSKGELYGVLDSTTREWKDGVFTATLRKIVDNVKGDDQSKKRHWIFFDGDVDPEWVENLNSLLDDNKLLTLPNGERLILPSNVRIMFEVQDLRFATPATVSRCGMVWFSGDTINHRQLLEHLVSEYRTSPYCGKGNPSFTFAERISLAGHRKEKSEKNKEFSAEDIALINIQNKVADAAADLLRPGGIFDQIVSVTEERYTHFGIMDYNRAQSIRAFFNLLAHSAGLIRNYTEQTEKEIPPEKLKRYVQRKVMHSLMWGFASQYPTIRREEFSAEIKADIPRGTLLDYEVRVEDGEWCEIRNRVIKTDIPAQKVGTNDVVIPTVDTARHEDVIGAWIRTGKPVILCGPPGSGKTMSLTAVLRTSTDYEVAFLNFSSGTAPDTITKIFDQYCTVKSTLQGLILTPTSGKKLIVFCDEINLPSADKYGTQRVIQFMRQLTERGGYYRSKDNTWVTIEHIQFAGACNPPTDPGRVSLTHRFLRWAPVLFVDFPSHESLISIYDTYCRGLLQKNLSLRPIASNLAKAMVEVYKSSQEHYTPEMQRHYVYSPRELSRWSRAIFEGIQSLDESHQKNLIPEELVRLAVHEGLRIFRDRLTTEEEGLWTDDLMNRCFNDNFPTLKQNTLERPILFSTVLTRAYTSVTREQLRVHIREKLKSFADEELDVELVVFDAVIDHVVRIDRVLRQPLGHMLLVGSSGVGKTILSRFVAWMNNMSVFQIKAHRGYTIADFEEDVRGVMRRAGKREKVCFIFDESNIMDSNFLEYMNALLASGEVPGLFDGEEWPKLMHEIRDSVNIANASGYVDTSSEPDMYKWFISNVQVHLHVVFTMNPHSPDFHTRSATSPALFNRCTIDWFGDWSNETIFQVARELTANLDVMTAFSKLQSNSDVAHDVVAQCMCRVHETVNKTNEMVRAQSANRGTFITPRHFLDFIQHFHSIYKEKIGAVEELQGHLNGGLSKLRETSDLVDQQQKNLTKKEATLAVSAQKAQEMLNQIIVETEKAKKNKEDATILKAQLEIESKKLNEDRSNVEKELSQAEPALKEAEAALNTIKPDHIREMRAYATPPPTVKKVLEAVITVLGEKRAGDWEVIKSYTRRDDFINQVKAFDPSRITEDIRDRINKYFISDATFTYETAIRASKAAGPLQKWVVAQIRYSEIFASVGPMRIEIEQLSSKYTMKLAGLQKAEKDIADNEASIERLKENYQISTAETTEIKNEINSVASRCTRAKALMEKLLAEKTRWEEQSANFRAQSGSVLGDCLISAGFLAYIGYFDEINRRKNILPEWCDVIDAAKIDFRRDLSITEYLSKPEDRLKWAMHKLPQDTLCVENAIIMERFNRYPLIIDPSGQAVEFLLNNMKEKKITKTSFVENGFIKQLEMAVRFGYPIIVQDVEYIDPILNPILNREVRRTGGRHLIRLGAQDIDISPTFKLYMSTRDSSFQFTPDICGRATMVNFTVTLSSLQSQCMHTVMLHERPDIDEKRTELMKLQGEYRLRLRILEQELLTAISASEGNILENVSLINTLETLKSESAEIQTKMGQSEVAYKDISDVEEQYKPMAAAASKLYFSLSNLTELNTVYRFSLRFFFDIVKVSLATLPSNLSAQSRIPIIIRNIFTVAHFRVTRSLFQADNLAFEIRLAQIRCSIDDSVGSQISTKDWEALLLTEVASKADISSLPPIIPKTLTQTQLSQIAALFKNTDFIATKQSMCDPNDSDSWNSFFESTSDPVSHIPEGAFGSMSKARSSFMAMLLCKVARRDAYTASAERFLRDFFDTDASGNCILEDYQQEPFFITQEGFNVHDTVAELEASVPLLMVAAAGYDASGRVEDLARQTGMSLQTVAMGSPEGYDDANSFISQAMRLGTWVLLKNIHLASVFMSTLEKKIHSEELENRINQNFRLFLSSEPSEKIPSSLISASILMVFEPPPGIKSNMLRTLSTINPAKVPQYPRELPRLYFIVSWLHSVIMERMNYLPLGWSKRYEFSEADFRRVIGTVDSWVGLARGERHHVPPQELPWEAIRNLVADTIYGGRIDNNFDQHLLKSFCSIFLSPEAFNPKFSFVNSAKHPICCDGTTLEDFEKWVKELPEVQSPEWLGLPAIATELVLIQRADATLERLAKIQNVFIDEDDADGDDTDRNTELTKSSKNTISQTEPSNTGARWAQKLMKSVILWQDIIGNVKFKPIKVTSTAPIALALKREAQVAEKLLEKVTGDLKDMIEVCKGTIKPNNYHRTIIDSFSKEIVPTVWRVYVTPQSLTIRAWLVDFRLRLDHLSQILNIKDSKINNQMVHLGSLMFPEAFLTATRQAVARHHDVALEQLEMQMTLYYDDEAMPPGDDSEVNIIGLVLHSAELNDQNICCEISDGRSASTKISVARLSWAKKEKVDNNSSWVDFPLYLNSERTVTLGVISLPVDTSVSVQTWYQRGVCVTAWQAAEK